MKQKQIIIYQKNGEEITKTINPFNKYKIVTTIFKNPFLSERKYDYYELKEDIEYLHLKNVTFYQNVRFICPKDTILILENCTFKQNTINFFGGNVQLIYPNLPNEFYCNRIYGTNLQDISIEVQNRNQYLNISLNTNRAYINIEEGISSLYLNGKEITLQNINKVKIININAKNTKIANSNIQLQKTNNIEETTEKFNACNIKTNALRLENSTIYSYEPLIIESIQMDIDEKSILSSNHDIIVGGNIYNNKNSCDVPQTITKQILQKETNLEKINRQFISILKTIRKQLEEQQENNFSENKRNSKIKKRINI